MYIEHVDLMEILTSDAWIDNDSALPLIMGIADNGESKIVDLAKLHSILIIGETGTGKVLVVQNIVTGLCLKYSSEQLKIIAVDLKAIEYDWAEKFSQLEIVTLPELVFPRIVELYHEFKHRQAEQDYNAPYCILIMDDLTDIFDYFSQDEIFPLLFELMQHGHTFGVYVMIATQRPATCYYTKSIQEKFGAVAVFSMRNWANSEGFLNNPAIESLRRGYDFLYQEKNMDCEKLTIPCLYT